MEERDGRAGGFRKVRRSREGGSVPGGGVRACSSLPLSAQDTVDRLLRLHFRDGRTRVNGDAQLLMAEMLNVFVREAAARAARQAQTEDLEKVDIEHLEKVLPQLLLDF
ncbi:centromere protein X isoform X1 [Pipra filicauda]|uniref:Centromere protein X n=1 Tax=Pipra filicauda TaxID=649802 RepID=A0A7R5L060_9PASS|nr:centromere protein X isoform X1 [Pipra filicauda]